MTVDDIVKERRRFKLPVVTEEVGRMFKLRGIAEAALFDTRMDSIGHLTITGIGRFKYDWDGEIAGEGEHLRLLTFLAVCAHLPSKSTYTKIDLKNLHADFFEEEF